MAPQLCTWWVSCCVSTPRCTMHQPLLLKLTPMTRAGEHAPGGLAVPCTLVCEEHLRPLSYNLFPDSGADLAMARHEAGGQGAKEVRHSVLKPAYTVFFGFILRSSDTNSQPTSAHVARAAGSRMPRLPLLICGHAWQRRRACAALLGWLRLCLNTESALRSATHALEISHHA